VAGADTNLISRPFEAGLHREYGEHVISYYHFVSIHLHFIRVLFNVCIKCLIKMYHHITIFNLDLNPSTDPTTAIPTPGYD